MQKFENVRSTAESVQEIEINDYFVILNNGITEVHEEAADEFDMGFDGWEIAEQIIYDKDEYMKILLEKNSSLEQEVTDLQTALAEVYEQVINS